ncbi:heterokaryon incompatibility protein-domain-containing protein [Pisolithus tinctorius]|uniref:Uncharacterized protein n=1 Tax=Pisolithus tinctorius Marx 270 TaxID=870435 RepID=A0A0C3PDL7_PISTI|nr:heterokaryon incompatibility protein-domain-containing protein [Pisolithus tinctorius]KIO05874.1 hypothetical protein M404DRAFT_506381 [Pisolithus tinctorius Marx 270]
MRLLDISAVLDRERDIQGADPEIEVLKELDDKKTSYAILSHRWGTEVTYKEITGLVTMNARRRGNVRDRDGYQKIIRSCEQAQNDGYRWLWIDTCCIDKRSSAELSEAINSMYRWYRNSQKCYIYLNDVDESAFPTEQDFGKFGRTNGWPEWFSRGWTLQELIAPRTAEFFNKRWVSIGTKEDVTSTLEQITGIPCDVLRFGLEPRHRPDVAQMMSWAAHRKTTRVEDRAYSLLGLFGVNMPMLYGEGSKAFQRLQLEIMRVTSDHSIFAWNRKGRFGWYRSVLADDPSCFRGRQDMKRLQPPEFVDELKEYMRKSGLDVDADHDNLEPLQRGAHSRRLYRFDVTNLGIQVWLPVIPDRRGPHHFKAILPCLDRHGNLITIELESRGLSSARCLNRAWIPDTWPEFTLLYLDCFQDVEEQHWDLMLYDKHALWHGFTRCGTFPEKIAGDTVTFSSQGDTLIVLVYANDNARSRFAVGLGYYLGRLRARIVCDRYSADQRVWSSWASFANHLFHRY